MSSGIYWQCLFLLVIMNTHESLMINHRCHITSLLRYGSCEVRATRQHLEFGSGIQSEGTLQFRGDYHQYRPFVKQVYDT